MAAKEWAEIDSAIRLYLEGMVYSQPEKLEQVMHPSCVLAGKFEDLPDFNSRDTFIAAVKGSPGLAPGTPYLHKVELIDIAGDVAVARVTADSFGTTFTDYLTFFKPDGRWQIVYKAFLDHAKAKA